MAGDRNGAAAHASAVADGAGAGTGQKPSSSGAGAGRASSSSGLRTTGVLARKYLSGYVRNPAMVGSALIPVGAAVLFHAVSMGIVDGVGDAAFNEWLGMLYTLYAFMFAGLMTSAMFVMYDMGEEAEKGARGVLLRAGVTHGQLAAGHLSAACVLLLAICLASGLVMGLDAGMALPLAVLCALCQLPPVVAGCAAGLFARTQNDVMVSSTPFIVVALIPFALYMTDSFESLIPYLPTGGMFGIAESLAAGDLLGGSGPVCLIMTLAWLAVALAALMWAIRRRGKCAA